MTNQQPPKFEVGGTISIPSSALYSGQTGEIIEVSSSKITVQWPDGSCGTYRIDWLMDERFNSHQSDRRAH